uniref:Uncharacterized protein n=1 Tax=Rangifer tarandus platyrhynchus TaxID=3082113 RepID=A0ACB0FK91_RANTA|nr:unnamed protein product [Rangifer tarandus platyrhynchus]
MCRVRPVVALGADGAGGADGAVAGPHPNPDFQRSAPNATGFTVVRGEGIRCQDALPLSHPVRDKEVRTHLAGAPSPGTSGAHTDCGPGPELPRRPLASLLARTSRTIPGRPAARALLRAPCRALPAGRSLLLTPGCALCAAPPRVLVRAPPLVRGVLAVPLPKLTGRVPGTFKGTSPRAGGARQPPPARVVGVGARFELVRSE